MYIYIYMYVYTNRNPIYSILWVRLKIGEPPKMVGFLLRKGSLKTNNFLLTERLIKLSLEPAAPFSGVARTYPTLRLSDSARRVR